MCLHISARLLLLALIDDAKLSCPRRMYFGAAADVDRDARKCLAAARSKILAGVHIVFSRVFPQAMSNPQTHSLWKLAEHVCARSLP